MQDLLDANREMAINVAIEVPFPAGVLICTVADTIVLDITMVLNQAYGGKIVVLDHTQTKNPSSWPDLHTEQKNQLVYAKLLEINYVRLC